MAAVFRRDDLKRNSGSTATVLCSQQFLDEFGQMVIWTHHMAAIDYTWSVAVLQLYGARPSLRHNRNWKKGGTAIGDRMSTGSGLLDEDQYLAEVNLGDLETTLGERQHYWLLAIKTAQKAKLL